MEQSGLGCVARAYDVFKVPLDVAVNLALAVSVAGTRDKHGDVDHQAAQLLNRGLEPWENCVAGPYIRRDVLGKVLLVELGGGLGAVERWVSVERAVGIERTLECVYLSFLELLLAQRPSREVFSCGILDFDWV